jgi:hypothetical protein
LNPRLRPWQGRTLPLSYSRSFPHFTVLAHYCQFTLPAEVVGQFEWEAIQTRRVCGVKPATHRQSRYANGRRAEAPGSCGRPYLFEITKFTVLS